MRTLLAMLTCAVFGFAPVAHAVEAVDDTTPPAVDIDFPVADGVIVDEDRPTFAGSGGIADGDVGTVTVEIFSGATATGEPRDALQAPVNDGSWTAPAPTSLPDGQYTLRARQQDGAGNVGTATAGFWIDSSTPVVVIVDPVDGAVTNDTTPTFSGGPSGAPGDADELTLEVIAGGASTPAYATVLDAGGPWEATPSAPLPDGAYVVRVTQEDDAGHSGFDEVRFHVDTTAPALTLTRPATEARGRALAFAGAAGHAAHDEPEVRLRLFSGTAASGTPIQDETVNVVDNQWYRSGLATLVDGAFYTVQVRQADAAGNVAVVERTFRVDNTWPVVPTLEAPAADARISEPMPEFRGTAGAAVGDDATVTVDIVGPTSMSLEIPVTAGRWSGRPAVPLAPGGYRVIVRHGDAVGHLARSTAIRFAIVRPPAPFVAPDRLAPAILLPKTITRSGRLLIARPHIGEAGTAVVTLRIGKAVLVRGSARVRKAGRLTVRLKPSRGRLARLLRSRRTLTLVVSATDAAGNSRTVKRLVKLKR
jgi:hypothetical protein